MVPEPYVGLIIGFILSIIASTASIVVTNRFTEKQWLREKKSDEWQETIQNIY